MYPAACLLFVLLLLQLSPGCKGFATGILMSIPKSDTCTAISSATIIGCGVGSLYTAALLAQSGCDVTVLEKNRDGGGRVSELTLAKEGRAWRFDSGPTLMLLPEVYQEAFRSLGVDPENYFSVKEVTPSYQAYFSDGTAVTLSKDQQLMRSQLEPLQPGSYNAYREYLDYCQLQLDVGLPNFIKEELDLSKMLDFVGAALAYSPLEGHLSQLKRRGFSPKLQALLSFQDLYVGLTPQEAPAVFGLLQAIELNQGIYYPVGGFQKIVKGLESVCRDLGVKFKYEAEVQQVLVEAPSDGEQSQKPQAKGVRLKCGEQMESDFVVMNADLPFAEKFLLPPEYRTKGRWKKAQYSSSVLAFYWAVDKRFPQLAHHNIFLSEDYENAWAAPFPRTKRKWFHWWDSGGSADSLGESVNFYVACPSRTDPTASPPGCDSVMVLVPCAPLDDTDKPVGADKRADARLKAKYDSMVAAAKAEVLRRFEKDAGMEGFGDSIVQEAVYTPLDWALKYNVDRGAVFGLSHGLSQLSVFRPPHKDAKVDGLYYVGASSKPGNGVPLVLIGAKLCSQTILKDLGIEQKGATPITKAATTTTTTATAA